MTLFAALLAATLAPAPAPAVEWSGVATASRGAVLVWSPDRVAYSDDGDQFTAVACGAGSILDLVVDDDGAFAVVLDATDDLPARLELHPRGGPVVTMSGETRRLAAGGGQLARLGEHDLERLDWSGRRLASIAIPSPCEGCGGAVASGDFDLTRDRTLRLTDTEINTCTSVDRLEWQRVLIAGPRATRATARTIRPDRKDYAATWEIGAHGWLYGVGYAGRLVAVGAGNAHPLLQVTMPSPWPQLLVDHNERTTVAAIDDSIWRLDGARAQLLARAPASPRSLALDARTRPLVLIDLKGEVRLQRFERARGWVDLRLPG